MASREEFLTNKIFLCAVLPLIKTIAMDDPKFAKKFEHAHAVIQVSAKVPEAPEGKFATHFVVNCGEWDCHTNKVTDNAHIELEFKSIETMNAFFKGKIGPATLPAMKGVAKKPAVFLAFMIFSLSYTDFFRRFGNNVLTFIFTAECHRK